MKIIKLFNVVFIALLGTSISVAAPVSEDERIPVDVRRTTLLVKDVEASMALYRDVLGMTVVYDQIIERGDPEKPESYNKSRLVLLRANDDFIGVLGLLQRYVPARPVRKEVFDQPVVGDPILVINSKNLDQIWDNVAALPGVKVILEPVKREYPKSGGGTIGVILTMLRDPDGYWVEINKILDAPAGTE